MEEFRDRKNTVRPPGRIRKDNANMETLPGIQMRMYFRSLIVFYIMFVSVSVSVLVSHRSYTSAQLTRLSKELLVRRILFRLN